MAFKQTSDNPLTYIESNTTDKFIDTSIVLNLNLDYSFSEENIE